MFNFNLPTERTINKNQTNPKIINNIKPDFDYWDIGDTINGSEFRSDPNHGYEFGFESRSFDNFNTSHIEPLLELLFLLADHLYDENQW